MHSHRSAPESAIALVGGESLLGKDVRELLESSNLSAPVRLIASDEGQDSSILTRGRDEPLVMTSLQAADLAAARIILLAGSKESSRKAYEQIQGTGAPVVVDLSGALEDQPLARLRAPLVEPAGYDAPGPIHVIAHPAATALALLFHALRTAGVIRRSVVHVFEPASEHGQAGLDELQKQTVGLLSFKPLVKDVFDAQVSFNMLPQYGSESRYSLEEIGLRIDRHLATLLAAGPAVPMPSLRVVQAPVFHGYSISVWAEFENDPGRDALVRALTSPQIDLRAKDEEAPTNVGVAGQSGISVGAISPDRNDPRAHWFWAVADNLRMTAENAVEVVRALLK
jgi:aspartate-semialdehyde dehydrogenase